MTHLEELRARNTLEVKRATTTTTCMNEIPGQIDGDSDKMSMEGTRGWKDGTTVYYP